MEQEFQQLCREFFNTDREQVLNDIQEDDRGIFQYCPECHNKCYYRTMGYEGWLCECDKCDIIMDED